MGMIQILRGKDAKDEENIANWISGDNCKSWYCGVNDDFLISASAIYPFQLLSRIYTQTLLRPIKFFVVEPYKSIFLLLRGWIVIGLAFDSADIDSFLINEYDAAALESKLIWSDWSSWIKCTLSEIELHMGCYNACYIVRLLQYLLQCQVATIGSYIALVLQWLLQ